MLSNPKEFKKVLQEHPPCGAATLADRNKEYKTETTISASQEATHLPFVVFADGAEVVLPCTMLAKQE